MNRAAATIEVDVLVAGGGNAGLCAALSAADEGASVMLVDRSPRWRRGGNTRHTRDIRYAHAEGDAMAQAPYPQDVFFADLAGVGEIPDLELAELLVAESQSLPSWMEAHGVRWQGPLRGSLHLDTNRFPLGGGTAMLNAYYRHAERAGVEVVYGTSAGDLRISSGRCTELTLSDAAGACGIAVKAVVVASGGLEANLSWLQRTWGGRAQSFIVRGTPDNDGSLLLELLEQGAAAAGSDLFHAVAVDARAPKFDGGIVTRVDTIPFGIAVNRNAERFYDEGEDAWPKRYAQWGQLIARQPGQIAYSIFDARAQGHYIPPLFPPLQASTLDELAALLDLDVPTFVETVTSYNRAVDDSRPFDHTRLDGRTAPGLDPQRSNWARALDCPPFCAYPVRPGLTFTYAGVKVDPSSRVQRSGGGSFKNVFAAGEAMAGNILTAGYLAGVGLTIGSVFGRIAGREAAHV